MIKLRNRPRADKLENEPRKIKSGIGRWVYLALLALLGIWMGNYAWGDLFILRADGLVLRERTMIAATTIARVEEINVREGQAVAAGDVLMRIASIDVLERIAEFSTRNAELAERHAALRSRERQATELLPLALEHMTTTKTDTENVKKLIEKGLVSSQRFQETTASAYNAEVEYVRLNAEKDGLELEIKAVEQALQHSQRALKDLEAHYASGVVYAAKSGRVGESVPSIGAVYRAGDPMMSVISGDAYVLAYLPENYIFGLKEGMPVRVSSGRLEVMGHVSEILLVSQAVPTEFQHAFRPDKRRQLVRIEFSSPSPFPTSANVEVTSPILEYSFRNAVDSLSRKKNMIVTSTKK